MADSDTNSDRTFTSSAQLAFFVVLIVAILSGILVQARLFPMPQRGPFLIVWVISACLTSLIVPLSFSHTFSGILHACGRCGRRRAGAGAASTTNRDPESGRISDVVELDSMRYSRYANRETPRESRGSWAAQMFGRTAVRGSRPVVSAPSGNMPANLETSQDSLILTAPVAAARIEQARINGGLAPSETTITAAMPYGGNPGSVRFVIETEHRATTRQTTISANNRRHSLSQILAHAGPGDTLDDADSHYMFRRPRTPPPVYSTR